MKITNRTAVSAIAIASAALISACSSATPTDTTVSKVEAAATKVSINPENWPVIETPALDPAAGVLRVRRRPWDLGAAGEQREHHPDTAGDGGGGTRPDGGTDAAGRGARVSVGVSD